ncbi:MAG: hypothetical protein AAF296_07455 [Pseudomonadota bacterium]
MRFVTRLSAVVALCSLWTAGCSGDRSLEPDTGRACSQSINVIDIVEGKPMRFEGVFEATKHGWIGLRFDSPVCLKLQRNNGREIGPLEYGVLAVGVPVDGRPEPRLPAYGVPSQITAEIELTDKRLRGSGLLLRVLDVETKNSPF